MSWIRIATAIGGVWLFVKGVSQWIKRRRGRQAARFGFKKEELLVQFFRRRGKKAGRSAGSRGPYDVWVENGQRFLLQLKSTQNPSIVPWPSPEEIKALRKQARKEHAVPLIAIGLPKGFRFFTLDKEEVKF